MTIMCYILCLVLGFKEEEVMVSDNTKLCQDNYLLYKLMNTHAQKYTDSQSDANKTEHTDRTKKVVGQWLGK